MAVCRVGLEVSLAKTDFSPTARPDGSRKVFPLAPTHSHARSPNANAEMLDCCRPLDWVKRYGITLAEFTWAVMR